MIAEEVSSRRMHASTRKGQTRDAQPGVFVVRIFPEAFPFVAYRRGRRKERRHRDPAPLV